MTTLPRIGHLIGGKLTQGGTRQADVFNPATGQVGAPGAGFATASPPPPHFVHDFAAAAGEPTAEPAAAQPAACPFSGLSVKQLLAELDARGISSEGMMEKGELLAALRAAPPRRG